MGKCIGTGSRFVVARGWGSDCLRGVRFFFGMTKRSWNWIEVVVTQVTQNCNCSKCHQMACFKMVNFVLCEFYHF